MRNLPNARELLGIASDTLRDTLATSPSERQRYSFALILSALGIAERELQGAPTPWPNEFSALRNLYTNQNGHRDRVTINGLNRQFANDLRIGMYDQPGSSQNFAHELLREDVLARLAEDNPRYQK